MEKLNIDLSGIKLLVADMAGTTMQDLHEVELCFAKACELTNLPATDEEILAYQGWKKITVFTKLWEQKLGANHPDLQNKIKHSYDTFCSVLEDYYITAEIVPTHGTLALFQLLRAKGIKIALTTGFYRKVTNYLIKRLGWDIGLDEMGNKVAENSIIDLSLCSDDVMNGRPAPDMIKLAMARLGITDPNQVINIGDTPNDLISGIEAGVRYSFGLTNGTHSLEQLSSYPNHGLLSSMDELTAMFKATELVEAS